MMARAVGERALQIIVKGRGIAAKAPPKKIRLCL